MSLGVVGIVAGIVAVLALLWAGALKLKAGPVWSRQAADMGVSRPVALVVPYVEMVVGVLLAAQLFTPWSAVAALGLFVAFTLVIGAGCSMAAGHRVGVSAVPPARWGLPPHSQSRPDRRRPRRRGLGVSPETASRTQPLSRG